jgi:hypothetical protein
MSRFILLLLLIGLVSTVNGQEKPKQEKQYFSLAANFGNGSVLPTSDFIRGEHKTGLPLEKFRFFSLKALWQNPGYQNWQRVYKGPYYGVGINFNDFYNAKEIGYPFSIYGILGVPVLRLKRVEFFTEFQYGISQRWQIYKSNKNPYNNVIGGNLNMHLKIGLNTFIAISKNVDIGSGISFLHFSNGGVKRPYKGFNIYAPFVELKYHFGHRPNTRQMPSPLQMTHSDDLFLKISHGNHQLNENQPDSAKYYPIVGIGATYSNQLSNALRMGYGLDINYWWGLNAQADGSTGPYSLDNFTLGAIIQPELILGRLTLVGGVGIYAFHKDYGNFKRFYQRIGARFNIYKNLSVGVNVRATRFKHAEFIEFVLGYRIKWKK